MVFLFILSGVVNAASEYEAMRIDIQKYLAEQGKMPSHLIRYAEPQGLLVKSILSPERFEKVLAEINENREKHDLLKTFNNDIKPVMSSYASAFKLFRGQYDEEYLDVVEDMIMVYSVSVRLVKEQLDSPAFNSDSLRSDADGIKKSMKQMLVASYNVLLNVAPQIMKSFDDQIKNGDFRADMVGVATAKMNRIKAKFPIYNPVKVVSDNSAEKPQQANEVKFDPPTDFVPLSKVVIKNRQAEVFLTKENLGAEVLKCVPTFKIDGKAFKDKLDKFPEKNSIVSIGHASSSKKFVYSENSGVCLEYSSNGYPIFAADDFLETVNPVGVPPDVAEEWFKKIAYRIAVNGRVKVAYVSDKGTAFVDSYWAEKKDSSIYYWSDFKKVGEWETLQLDFTFSHPGLQSHSSTTRSGSMRKTFFINK